MSVFKCVYRLRMVERPDETGDIFQSDICKNNPNRTKKITSGIRKTRP